MRAAIVLGVVLFAALATASALGRSPEREALAERHFSREQILRGRQFAFERRLLFWSHEAAQLALLGLIVASGALARLQPPGARWWLRALVAGGVLLLAQELVSLPWSVYGGLHHLRAWGLTERSFSSWLGDHLKALCVSGLIGALLLLGFYGLMRVAPRAWWLLAGLGSAAVAAFFALLAPVLVAPLFNRFEPIRNTPHAALQPRIEALAREASLPVRDVLVMDASRQGRHTNAYFTGFFGTRRIVLYDTLLRSHTPDETLSILGHEMGHWRRHHIVKGVALGALGALLGFFLLARILEWAATEGRFGLRDAADPAGLPLVLLLGALASLVALPAQNLVSRAFEREADRDALLLYGHPEVFIEAEKRLARDNISNVAPSDLNVFLFASHPPTLERIAMAESSK
jgi:STE24 endopeptidase